MAKVLCFTANTGSTAKYAHTHTHTQTFQDTHVGCWLVSSSNISPLEYCHLFGVSMDTKHTNEVGCVFPCVIM